MIVDSKNHIGLKNDEIVDIKLTELPIADRYSTGSQLVKKVVDAFLIPSLVKAEQHQEPIVDSIEEVEELEEKVVPKKERISLQEIDDRLMTIDDFLDESNE